MDERNTMDIRKIELDSLKVKIGKYRYALVAVFIAGSSLGLFCFWEPTQVEEYPYLDPHVTSVDDSENLIVNIQPLREELTLIDETYSDRANMSLYFEALDTGENLSINRNLRIWPVSLAKVPLAISVMKKIENSEGKLDLDDLIPIIPDDVNTRSGDLYQGLKLGDKMSIRDLIFHMLNNSDNTAYRALIRQVDQSYLRDVVDLVGVDQMFQEGGKVSSKEYSRLFRALYYSTFLNPEDSEFILKTLAKTTFSDYLSQGLPEETRFAHKWGENLGLKVYADSGIVYATGRPYMISVMIEMKSDDATQNRRNAVEMMGKISNSTYSYVSSYSNSR